PPARLLVAYREKQVKSPIDPTLRSPTVVSTACAASSTITTPWSRAIASIASMSHGAPAMCTGITAFVRSVIAAANAAGSRFSEPGSMSANTGTAPAWMIAFAVAGQVNELVIPSSPLPTPAATSERCSASVQDDVAMAWGDRAYAANRSSSSRTRGPDGSQPGGRASVTGAPGPRRAGAQRAGAPRDPFAADPPRRDREGGRAAGSPAVDRKP